MRNLTSLILLASLVCFPATVVAQDDPFGGSSGGNPFGDGKTRPPAVKQPKAKQAALKAKTVPARDPSEVTQRIRSALGDETTQSFVQLPLQDAVQQLSGTHDIPIVVDKRALEEVGLAPDTPVTLSLRRVSLRSFLRLMLRELELTYMIKDEVMQITTVEAAEQNLVVEMYTISEGLTEKADKIVEALTSSVVPAAWDVKGGPCSVKAIDNVLIVFATETIHEDAIEFLQKLEQAFENQKAKKKARY